jgi:hypothetical protein
MISIAMNVLPGNIPSFGGNPVRDDISVEDGISVNVDKSLRMC